MIKLLNKCQTTAMIRSLEYWSHHHQHQRHLHLPLHHHQHHHGHSFIHRTNHPSSPMSFGYNTSGRERERDCGRCWFGCCSYNLHFVNCSETTSNRNRCYVVIHLLLDGSMHHYIHVSILAWGVLANDST